MSPYHRIPSTIIQYHSISSNIFHYHIWIFFLFLWFSRFLDARKWVSKISSCFSMIFNGSSIICCPKLRWSGGLESDGLMYRIKSFVICWELFRDPVDVRLGIIKPRATWQLLHQKHRQIIGTNACTSAPFMNGLLYRISLECNFLMRNSIMYTQRIPLHVGFAQ